MVGFTWTCIQCFKIWQFSNAIKNSLNLASGSCKKRIYVYLLNMVEVKERSNKMTSKKTKQIRKIRLTTLDTFFKFILKFVISALWLFSLYQFSFQSCPLIIQSLSVLVAELSSDYPVLISYCCRREGIPAGRPEPLPCRHEPPRFARQTKSPPCSKSLHYAVNEPPLYSKSYL